MNKMQLTTTAKNDGPPFNCKYEQMVQKYKIWVKDAKLFQQKEVCQIKHILTMAANKYWSTV